MKEAAVQGKSAVALGPCILPVGSSWGRAQPGLQRLNRWYRSIKPRSGPVAQQKGLAFL